jgi:hypothetical protein
MDKQTLFNLINSSTLNDQYKKELTETVSAAPVIDKKFIGIFRKKIADIQNLLVEKIANLQIQDAAQEFNSEMKGIQKDVDQLNAQISKKADEIDLKTVRAKI